MYRPPIVVILGHVDHGKTTLLDYIRKSRLTKKESGGITQKIGAYEIDTKISSYHTSKITFIDTPGHEAFSRLRSRGAKIADIAVLVIDSKDLIKPQTIESISHIKSAKIPMIIALNKIDLPDADPKRVITSLLKHEVVVDKKGGDVITVELSAKTGKGVNDLLEAILITATDLNLKYKDTNPAEGFIIETKKDRRGIAPTIVIKDGHLKVGDTLYFRSLENVEKKTKIRAFINDLGKSVKELSPSTPVEVLGFKTFPAIGSKISVQLEQVIEKTKVAKKVEKETEFDIESFLKSGKEEKKLSLIIKTDSQGSLETINSILSGNENLKIIFSGIGEINKSDVFLAKTTNSIIVGFSIKIDSDVKELSENEKVVIKTYKIIYELLEELEEVSALLHEKEQKKKTLKAEAKILAKFTIEGETIAGVKVIKGKINLGDKIKLFRKDNQIGESKVVSLKIRAKKVEEIKKNQEAGIVLSPQLDITAGDMIKSIL